MRSLKGRESAQGKCWVHWVHIFHIKLEWHDLTSSLISLNIIQDAILALIFLPLSQISNMQMNFHFNSSLNRYINTNLFLTKAPKQKQQNNGKLGQKEKKLRSQDAGKKKSIYSVFGNSCRPSLLSVNYFPCCTSFVGPLNLPFT